MLKACIHFASALNHHVSRPSKEKQTLSLVITTRSATGITKQCHLGLALRIKLHLDGFGTIYRSTLISPPYTRLNDVRVKPQTILVVMVDKYCRHDISGRLRTVRIIGMVEKAGRKRPSVPMLIAAQPMCFVFRQRAALLFCASSRPCTELQLGSP